MADVFPDRYHAERRKKIIADHPELRDFMIHDPSFKYVAASCALTQLFVAYILRNEPLLEVFIFSLICGPLFNCAIANALHETVHDLALTSGPLANKVFGNFINLSLAWPVIGGYYKAHRYHHSYLGSVLDVKYPPMEEAVEYDKNIWTRLKFVFLHPILGGERWAKNVKEKPTDFAYWNLVSVYTFNIVILILIGWQSLLYLLLSFWINDTIFVQGSKNFADHWVDETTTHTYSNYGWFNLINFNIGYHREHHDFPNVPGRYLPKVNEVARKYYSDPNFIQESIFKSIFEMLIAEPYQGIVKHANKLTFQNVALQKDEMKKDG